MNIDIRLVASLGRSFLCSAKNCLGKTVLISICIVCVYMEKWEKKWEKKKQNKKQDILVENKKSSIFTLSVETAKTV